MNARKLLIIAAFGFAAVVAIGSRALSNPSVEADYVADRPPELVAATFSSEWCASCKVIAPRLAAVAPDFAEKPVRFAELDFTFGRRGDLEQKAAALGLGELYPRFKGATGFTLLVDAETGEIIDTLTINHSEKAMRAAIAQALAIASADAAR